VWKPDIFDKHHERMRYPTFRAQHLFAGTGVIEAGCKTLIGSRCKPSGMLTVRANAILAPRCCQSNVEFESYRGGAARLINGSSSFLRRAFSTIDDFRRLRE
jgi:hypothetical protein